MIRLSAIIASFEAEFLARYGHQLLPGQYRALRAIKQCRSAFGPQMQVHCADCDEQRLIPHSCGHRACPQCQHHESEQWLAAAIICSRSVVIVNSPVYADPHEPKEKY